MELQLLLLAAIGAVVLVAFPFAVEQLRCEIDRQRLCAAARAFGGVVATRFLTEPCTRCRGREMGLRSVGPQALWIRYQCRSCGQLLRADVAAQSASEAGAPYQHYQTMRTKFSALHRGSALRIDIVFRSRAAAPARTALRAPAPARRRRRGLRASRARAQARGWL
jgi:hypothetical protein